MSKSIPNINEILSLTVMLLMVIALVAGQAGATVHEEVDADNAFLEASDSDQARMPFRTTIKAHIDGEPLTISIDASAEFDFFRLEDE